MNNFLKLLTKSPLNNVFFKINIRLLSGQPITQSLRETFPLNKKVFKAGFRHSDFSSKVYDVNTNVVKDVILYKYENPRGFKLINIFGITQFIFWTYLSHFAYTTLKDAPVEENEESKWYQRINLGENKYRNGLTMSSFLIGYGILFATWMYTVRSVRFLILRKGGKNISLVTYVPFGNNRILTAPLECISAQQPRELVKSLLPLKVRNRFLFYILDMRGEFRNKRLYDYTAGLKRNF